MGMSPSGQLSWKRNTGGRRRSYSQMSDINVTPFVDVMLVLLVIFMVTAPLLTAGVQVNLPEAGTESLPQQNDVPVTISLTADNEIYVGEERVSLTTLLPALTDILQDRGPSTTLYIRGDQALAYGEMVKIMTILSEAGYTRLSLVSDPIGN